MNNVQKFSLGALFTIGLIYLAKKKNTTANQIQPLTWDSLSDLRIQTLYPSIRDKAVQFLNAASNQGINLRVTEGLRSFDTQAKYYNQGRTTPGNIITYAKPGESYHNYGLAFDVVPMVNGQSGYNTADWNKIGTIGKSFGFTWGGDFTHPDRPHFEMTFGNSIAQLQGKLKNNDFMPGTQYLNLTA